MTLKQMIEESMLSMREEYKRVHVKSSSLIQMQARPKNILQSNCSSSELAGPGTTAWLTLI